MAAVLIDYSQKGFGDNVKRSHIALGLAVFTVGILSIVPGVSAAKPAEIRHKQTGNWRAFRS
jgi:hypothetical protein